MKSLFIYFYFIWEAYSYNTNRVKGNFWGKEENIFSGYGIEIMGIIYLEFSGYHHGYTENKLNAPRNYRFL